MISSDGNGYPAYTLSDGGFGNGFQGYSNLHQREGDGCVFYYLINGDGVGPNSVFYGDCKTYWGETFNEVLER